MNNARRLEQLGVSNSIARKDPLEGSGEVNGYGQRVSTWGDFASRFWEEHPEWELDQVYDFLGLTNKPYDPAPQEDVFGNFKADHDQRTVQNPNPFNLAKLRNQEIRRFGKEVSSGFAKEQEYLSSVLDDTVERLKEPPVDGDTETESTVEEEINKILSDEKYIAANEVAWARPTVAYDDVWSLKESHPQKQKYRRQKRETVEAMNILRGYEDQVILLQRKLRSIGDFGVAIPLSSLLSEMYDVDIDHGTEWDMRGSWLAAAKASVDGVMYGQDSDIPWESRAREIFVTQEDIERARGSIYDSDYELRKYGEACWEMIEPIATIPRLEDHSLVTGEGVK